MESKGMYISRYNQSFNAKFDSGLDLSSFTLFLSLFLLTFQLFKIKQMLSFVGSVSKKVSKWY
jgi:hypothetical protein